MYIPVDSIESTWENNRQSVPAGKEPDSVLQYVPSWSAPLYR